MTRDVATKARRRPSALWPGMVYIMPTPGGFPWPIHIDAKLALNIRDAKKLEKWLGEAIAYLESKGTT